MDTITKNIFIFLFALLFTSCNKNNNEIPNNIIGANIELFKNVGMNIRFISDSLNARVQLRKDNEFCDLILENGRLFSTNCNDYDNEFLESKLKKVIPYFLELNLSGVSDIDGKGSIVFRENGKYYMYSKGFDMNELKSKISSINSIRLVDECWYILEVTKSKN